MTQDNKNDKKNDVSSENSLRYLRECLAKAEDDIEKYYGNEECKQEYEKAWNDRVILWRLIDMVQEKEPEDSKINREATAMTSLFRKVLEDSAFITRTKQERKEHFVAITFTVIDNASRKLIAEIDVEYGLSYLYIRGCRFFQ